jgi:hypothetical protein
MTKTASVFIGVGALALFAYAVQTAGAAQIVSGIQRVGWWFAVILLLSGAREAVRAFAWTRTIEGAAPLPFGDALRARLAGEALSALLPMGMLVGEPLKASHVQSRVPFRAAFTGLAVEFGFYTASLILLLGAGAATFLGFVSGPYLLPLLSLSIALVACLAPTLRRIGAVRRGVAFVRGFSERHPEHLRTIALCELAYQALAVAEVYLTLWLVSPQAPTVAAALVLETVSRLIVIVFKPVPMRVGVDEASASLVAAHLSLAAPTGLALALIRKLRLLFWSAVGVTLIWAVRRVEQPSHLKRTVPWLA